MRNTRRDDPTGDTRLTTIEWTAQQVLNDLNLVSLPIDPFEIARARRIAVQPKDVTDGGVWGMLVKAGDEFGILYATHISSEGFVRFTIAHDLGHYFIEGHAEALFANGVSEHREGPPFKSNDPIEKEADHFAACLLMPETLFLEETAGAGAGLDVVRHLATTCRTSLTSTAMRYASLADSPVAAVFSRGQCVTHSWLSAEMKALGCGGWIRKGSPLPSRCLTRDFNSNSENVRLGRSGEGSSNLEDWISGARDINLGEDVVGLGPSGSTLTILFPCEEEDDDDDVLREED